MQIGAPHELKTTKNVSFILLKVNHTKEGKSVHDSMTFNIISEEYWVQGSTLPTSISFGHH